MKILAVIWDRPWEYMILFLFLSGATLYFPQLVLILLWILILLMGVLEAMKIKLWHGFSEMPNANSDLIRNSKVSVHLAICNEPPEMVLDTIASILSQDYADFELVIVDNNTKSAELWSPVAEYCRPLNNVRFFHLERWPFYKSGALNFARKMTNAEAEFIFVIDADYILERNALSIAVANIVKNSIALVQFPQAYTNNNPNHVPLLNEFDHFFDYYCSKADSCYGALATGTLSLIRINALDTVGGWPANSITEDAELGSRLQVKGYDIKYVHRIIVRGIAPIQQEDFLKQRKRWIFGNVQTLMNYSMDPFRNFNKWLSGISQLTAWTNMLGFPILCLLSCLILYPWLDFAVFGALAGTAYLAYWIFAAVKMLQLYLTNNGRTYDATRTFLIHFASVAIGAFYWWPVLLGKKRPFIRTNKSNNVSNYKFNLFYPLLHLGLFFGAVYTGFTFIAVSALFFCTLHSIAMYFDYQCRTGKDTALSFHLKLQS